MIVRELIEQLQKQPADARVWMGYDGNIVVTEAVEVLGASVVTEENIPDTWWRVKPSEVVILTK